MGSYSSVCPGCGLALPAQGLAPDSRANASGECRALQNEVSYYTLAHGRERFIHQHLVDAYGAQHARADGPAIGAAFALAGLYLGVERGFTGLQVQRIHMLMANRGKAWPRFWPPVHRASLTVADVLAAEPGPARDEALMDWCAVIWQGWRSEQARVREMVDPFL